MLCYFHSSPVQFQAEEKDKKQGNGDDNVRKGKE